MHAVVDSICGNHHEALVQLERGILLASSIPHTHPLRLDLYNSTAVELIELGCPDQARQLISPVIASPFARVYPEWLETASAERLIKPRCLIPGFTLVEPADLIVFPTPENADERRMLMRMKASGVALRSSDATVLETVAALETADHERVEYCKRLIESDADSFALAKRSLNETDSKRKEVLLQFWDRMKQPRERPVLIPLVSRKE